MRVIGGETLYEEGTEKSNSWMLIPISVFGENAARRKNTITEFLNGRGVETRPVLTGNFLAQPAIQRIMKQPADAMKYTNATKIAKEAFLVGAHHELSQEQIRYLCDTLVEADGLI
jgi:CDP-6-deoxy-D-xylo-4-hexulose-3-dehydrase